MSTKKTAKAKSSKSHMTRHGTEAASLRVYFKEIGKMPLLSEDKETQLIARAQNGDEEAASELISSNLRFVVTVARQYQGRSLPLSDLISEGNLGLMRALETFDVTKGTRFITYAVWWIKQSIWQALYNKSRMVRVPQKQQNEALRHLRSQDQANEIFNSRLTDLDSTEIQDVAKTPDNLQSDYLLPHHSLQAPMDRDSSESLIDIIPDDNTLCPEKEISTRNLKQELRASFRVLEENERRCLEMMYAFHDESPMTLDEVAQRLSLSRSDVKQLKAKAIAKLRRNPSVTDKLGEFLVE
ncbi:RNA polymerase sigma factor RpoD/SigA [bacterium]|nr:RNA polymerase sigma factor RpoD/SigA [bacterium]